jgi:GAF domain-containing protein
MNTVETRTRTTSTHPAVDPRFAAAARLAREATSRHTTPQACRAIVDALSTPALGFEGIALVLDPSPGYPTYQVVAGGWPPLPEVDMSAILTVPLLLDDERIGELTVFRSSGEFEEAEAALVTAAAAHASLGVGRARLQEELRRLRTRVANREAGAKGAGAAKKRKARASAKRKSNTRRKVGAATRKRSPASRASAAPRARRKAAKRSPGAR